MVMLSWHEIREKIEGIDVIPAREFLSRHGLTNDAETVLGMIKHSENYVLLNTYSVDDCLILSDKMASRMVEKLSLFLDSRQPFVRFVPRGVSDEIAENSLNWNWSDRLMRNILEIGEKTGLILPSINDKRYFLPVAYLLSYVEPSLIKRKDLIHKIRMLLFSGTDIENHLDMLIDRVLSGYEEKEVAIVKEREGLLAGKKKTLRELGVKLSLSRERIRQIEKEFWVTLNKIQHKRAFLLILIGIVLKNKGKLVYELSSSISLKLEFLLKLLEIPFFTCPKNNAKVLIIGKIDAAFQEVFSKIALKYLSQEIESVAEFIATEYKIHLSRKDLLPLSELIVCTNCKKLNKSQKVYLSLKKIGKPAHFSRVAEVYNKVFPGDLTAEHNVHAILNHQKYGTVWIGIKGVYALTEWGYEKPEKSLFETVAEIVQSKYKQFNKPVDINVIRSEIGKYRKIVKPSSFFIALHLNDKIQCIAKDTFIPKMKTDRGIEEDWEDELDKILARFESSNAT